MFLLSSKVEYGILGVLALCLNAGQMSVRSISEKENLSARFLEQAMNRLKETGLIESVRGSYGGYRLAKEPRLIKLLDVISAIEGKKKTVSSLTLSLKPEILSEISSGAAAVLEDHLNAIDFETLAQRVRTLQQEEALMFHI